MVAGRAAYLRVFGRANMANDLQAAIRVASTRTAI
jgi:hypothetical protein